MYIIHNVERDSKWILDGLDDNSKGYYHGAKLKYTSMGPSVRQKTSDKFCLHEDWFSGRVAPTFSIN